MASREKMLELWNQAEEIFGSEDTVQFMYTRHKLLDNHFPVVFAMGEEGYARVQQILIALQYGLCL